MESLTKTGTGKVPTFTGMEEDFQVWWTRFLAFACMCMFSQALQEGEEAEMPATDSEEIDITTAAGKKTAAAKKRNAVQYQT
jgi:hypothetical protein